MSTNQENRHFQFKELHNPGGSATVLESDHLQAYLNSGASAGLDFNGTRLDYINKAIPGTFTGLPEAMQAFAVSQGFTNWNSIGAKNSDEPPLPVQGKCAVSESGAAVTISFDLAVAATASQEANGWEVWAGFRQISLAGGTVNGLELRLTNESAPILRNERPVLAYYNAAQGSLKGQAAPGLNVVSIFGLEVPNGSQQ